jgi:hypothetical protein
LAAAAQHTGRRNPPMVNKPKKSKITKKAAKKMAKKSNASSLDKVYSERHESFIAAAFLPRPPRY